MRALLQRVSHASVSVEGETVGKTGEGFLILLGVMQGDTGAQAILLAEKTALLRVFEDEAGKMNRSLLDIGGEALVVSQFTLCADTRKGRRPSFTHSARRRRQSVYMKLMCRRCAGSALRAWKRACSPPIWRCLFSTTVR